MIKLGGKVEKLEYKIQRGAKAKVQIQKGGAKYGLDGEG